jgi:hypothetical protein
VRELSTNRPRRVARKLRRAGHVAASWTETVVGRDDLGEWAVLAGGAPVHRESGTVLRYQSPQVFCYPHDGWWVARLGGPDLTFHAIRTDGTIKTFRQRRAVPRGHLHPTGRLPGRRGVRGPHP